MKVILLTGADAKYFSLAQSTIRSIRERPQSRGIAMGFLDLGCTPTQREWLQGQVDFVREPEWEFDFPGRETAPGYLRGLFCRPFFPRYFPGFEVYGWIDADAWVNHWSAVDLLIRGAARRGMAAALEMDRGYQVHFGGERSLFAFMFQAYRAMYGDELAERLHTYIRRCRSWRWPGGAGWRRWPIGRIPACNGRCPTTCEATR